VPGFGQALGAQQIVVVRWGGAGGGHRGGYWVVAKGYWHGGRRSWMMISWMAPPYHSRV
jgi:hypothetical protein